MHYYLKGKWQILRKGRGGGGGRRGEGEGEGEEEKGVEKEEEEEEEKTNKRESIKGNIMWWVKIEEKEGRRERNKYNWYE